MHSFSLIQSSRLLSHIIIEPHSWTQPGAERQFRQLYTDIQALQLSEAAYEVASCHNQSKSYKSYYKQD